MDLIVLDIFECFDYDLGFGRGCGGFVFRIGGMVFYPRVGHTGYIGCFNRVVMGDSRGWILGVGSEVVIV